MALHERKIGRCLTRRAFIRGLASEVWPVPSVSDPFLVQALASERALRTCLYRYTRNSSDVDELLQETYARLLQAGAHIDPQLRSVRAFALTVARNLGCDHLRHQQLTPVELVADLDALNVLDEGRQVDEIVNSDQELALLGAAIAALPARCRQVFTLRKVYGYSQREIAVRLGISENTVEQHLSRAARRCRARLSAVTSPSAAHPPRRPVE